MNELWTVGNVGVYRHEQRYRARLGFDGLSLNVSGLRAITYGGLHLEPPGPFLMAALNGWDGDFDYGPDRENWVAMFRQKVFRPASRPGHAEFAYAGQWLQVPVLVPVPVEQAPYWRQRLRRLRETVSSPTPENRFAAHALVLEILRGMLEAGRQAAPESPAARLKSLIDADDGFRKTLGGMSAECGYTLDHLRVLFADAYKLSPGEYRAQRRLSLALDLLNSPELSVKQIAARLGFAHASAFSAFFRKMSGRPAAAARKLYRFA